MKVFLALILILTIQIKLVHAETGEELFKTVRTAIDEFEKNNNNLFGDPNKPSELLGEKLEIVLNYLEENKEYKQLSKSNLAFRAYWIQVINHLKHASLEFEVENKNYTHKQLFTGRYPQLPTLQAIKKAIDFFNHTQNKPEGYLQQIAENKEKEQQYLEEQTKLAKAIIKDPLNKYLEFSNYLETNGANASFKDFKSTIEYLLLKVKSEPQLIESATKEKIIWNFRDTIIKELEFVIKENFPYRKSIDAIERTMEFYDVYRRSADPERSPILYHSGRYEYYLHYLKSTAPGHILYPTLANLGATDLIKVRGVPIGFAGVNTTINYVDGYFQTPYEFYIHDINHARRMFLFFEKVAKRNNLSIKEAAKLSDHFVKSFLLPNITLLPTDDKITRGNKQIIKMLIFEMFHEDALAAMPEELERALLRQAGVQTPFEEIREKRKVSYVMQPGASTLAYLFRKISHDFYDQPGDRFRIIVEPEFRNYESILNATIEFTKNLGIKADKETLEVLLKQDTGFPEAFKTDLERDNLLRPKETVPLISNERALFLATQIFNNHFEESQYRDVNREMRIINFYREKLSIVVRLYVPVKDERNSIEILVSVPNELFEINHVIGSINEIKNQKRIIEISSGPHLSINSLKDDLLSKLNTKDYLIALRADDPKINDLILACRENNLKTILLVDTNSSKLITDISPTYFITVKNSKELNTMWNQIIKEKGLHAISHNMRIDFKSNTASLSELARQIESEKLQIHRSIQDIYMGNGIPIVNLSEFKEREIGKRTPICFLSPSQKDWDRLTQNEKDKIINSITMSINGLNSEKSIILINGELTNFNLLINQKAKEHNIKTLQFISEGGNTDSIIKPSFVHISSVANEGVTFPILKYIQSQNGYAFLIQDKNSLVSSQYNLAKSLNLEFQIIHSANNTADTETILSSIYKKEKSLISTHYQHSTRDSIFESSKRNVAERGIKIVSYEDLIQNSKNLKTILINGYVDLGYENSDNVRETLRRLMITYGDNILFTSVGTHKGIGLVYDWIPEIAKELGYKNIKTAAIVSRNALLLEKLAPMDMVHFVNTDVNNWRPTLNNEDLQLRFIRDTKGKLITFMGGAITRTVINEFISAGLPVEIYYGDKYQPNKEKVRTALLNRADTNTNSLVDLYNNRKKLSRDIKFFTGYPKIPYTDSVSCKNLFK